TGKLPGVQGAESTPAPAEAANPPGGGMPQAMPVSVSESLGMAVTRWNEFSGRLRAVEDVQVRPRVSGMIDAVHFAEGDIVQKDDRLFTIDLRPYRAAYNQAQAALAAAKA